MAVGSEHKTLLAAVERGGVTSVPPTLLTAAIYLLLLLLVGEWVYLDAAARGSRVPTLWAFGSIFGGFVLCYYVAWYRRRHDRTRPPTPVERWFRLFAVAAFGSILLTPFLTPPDPFTGAGYVLASLVGLTALLAVGRHLRRRLATPTNPS